MKKILLIIIMFVCTIIVTGCSNENNLGINFNIDGNETTLNYDTDNPLVAMQIKNYGAIVIELYPDIAPNTVNNFISLTKKGFYDNNTFHRFEPNFVLQGGDPLGNGSGGPGYHIHGEFANNNFKNDLKHTRGVISMGRTTLPNTAGSQFFIVLSSRPDLDGNYAAFGKIIDGMDTIEEIEKKVEVENKNTGKLKKNLIISKALIDLKGKEYSEVEKV